MEKQEQFVADASHEQKIPVSIIKANCSVLYANAEQTIASQKEWLDNIGAGADRMTALIQGLLALSKIEGAYKNPIRSTPRKSNRGMPRLVGFKDRGKVACR